MNDEIKAPEKKEPPKKKEPVKQMTVVERSRAKRKAMQKLLEIKKAELEFEAKLAEMEVDIFALEAADVQDARKAHKGDWTPRIFGLLALVGFLAYIFLVTIQPPDANSDTIVSLVLGYLGGLVSGISAFYFGASHAKD